MLFSRLAEGEVGLPPFSEQRAAAAALGPLRGIRLASTLRLREIGMLPARLLNLAFGNSR